MAVTADAAETPSPGPEVLAERARAVSRFLKALSTEYRLLLLCLLAEGEKSVSELERALGLRQPAISQQLARLRAERLVVHRRQGKSIYYSLASVEPRREIALRHDLLSALARQTRDEAGPRRAAGAK